MKTRLSLVTLHALVTLAACVPVHMGSPSLAGRESPLFAPSAYDAIDHQLRQSVVYAACSVTPGKPGAVANLDATLIPSDEYTQEGRRAQALIEPFRFTIMLTNGPRAGDVAQVTVPAGFVSDFHSTPDAAVGVTLSIRKALEAAVVHDWLYAVGRQGDEKQRELADQVYSDILAHYGVDSGTNWTVSTAIRWNGAKHFGAPEELRFYNKCFYGWCSATEIRRVDHVMDTPVIALPDDPAMRRKLWDLTVCIRPSATADSVSAR